MSNLNIFVSIVSSVNTSIVSRVVNCSVSNISIAREIKIKIQNKKKCVGKGT